MRYGSFAAVYDRLMTDDVDYNAWCDYIENIFGSKGIEPDTICELACGTGSITSRLERRGYDMTGVDISAEMLTVASGRLKRAELFRSDMASFSPPQKYYGAFLCMIDGINYLIAPKQLENTFKTVKTHLDGGVFIFDVSTRHKLKNVIGGNTFIRSEYDVFCSWQNRFIEKNSLSDMYLNFFVREGDGRYSRFEERHLQRGWSERQLSFALRRAGFSDISAYDELTFDPPRPDSDRIVFVCS